MTERADTATRIALLMIAGAAIVAMYAVAAMESLSRFERFVALSALGFAALAGWPGTALAQRYETRRPLPLARGKPPQPAGASIAKPQAADTQLPARYALASRNNLVALAVALVAAAGSGVIGWALAGSPTNSDGGFLVYMVFAGSLSILIRSIFRLASAAGAVELSTEALTLGPALGYLRSLEISRADAVAIEFDQQHPRVALVTRKERRFEIDAAQLVGAGFPAALATAWPGVAWREWPAGSDNPA